MNKKITIKSIKGIFKKTIEPNMDGPASILDLTGSDNIVWDVRQSNTARVLVNADLSDLRIVGQKEGDVLVLYVNTVLGGDLTFSRYNNVRYAVDQSFVLGQGHYIISMVYLNGKFNANIMEYENVYGLIINVVDAIDMVDPISDATVTLLIDAVEEFTGTTNADGQVVFYDVPEAVVYDMTIEQSDYTSILDGEVAALEGQVEFSFHLTRVLGDLTLYTAALAAVDEIDYTVESWAIYQLVVADNVVTTANKQSEIDAATLAITTAQADLVLV